MLTQKIFVAAQNGSEFILWLLLILSVVSIGAIIERFVALRSLKAQNKKAVSRIREALQSANLNELEDLAKDRDSIEGRAVSYAFRHLKDKGAEGIEEIFNSIIVMERPAMEKYLNYLGTLGSNAPFVGLLGTVLGIMKAFNDLGVEQNASAVMVGIAEALVSTAVGLFVAIPAVIAYNYFQKQVKSILQGLEAVKQLCIAYAKQSKRS